jgi:type IV pilus assembly protein PilN
MIRINLLPVKQLKAEVSRRREVVLVVSSLATVLFALGSLYAYQFRQVSLLEHELADLRAELQQFNVKAKDVADLQHRIQEFQGKHKVIEDINKKKSGPVRVMENLSAATPAALWLTQFKETGGDLTITGVAMDNQTIADFLKALGSHANFRGTELVETVQSDQAGVLQRRFLIRAKLLYQTPTQTSANNAAPIVPAVKSN